MWQTKYASAIPKNLGVGVDFRSCSEGNFLTGRPYSGRPYSVHAIKLSLRIQEDFNPIVYCTSAKNAQISKYVLASYVRSFAFVTQSFKLVL